MRRPIEHLLLGGDPPDVRVPASVAYRLRGVLDRDVQRVTDNGGQLPAEVAAVVRAVRYAASQYAACRVAEATEATYADVSDGLTQPGESRPSRHDLLTVRDVAERLGCGEPNVRDLHRRGRLPGWTVGGRIMFDPVTVGEFVRERDSAA